VLRDLAALTAIFIDDRGTSARLVQRPRRRRLPGLAADEENPHWWFLASAQQVEQVLVRADQENSVLLQTTGRTLSDIVFLRVFFCLSQ